MTTPDGLPSLTEVAGPARDLRSYMGDQQIQIMGECCHGQDKWFYRHALRDLAETIATMPAIYAQTGKGNQATAFPHYFTADRDFYVTEIDRDNEDGPQAFGWVSGPEPEWGYGSIAEWIASGAVLDCHFIPEPISGIIGSRQNDSESARPQG